MINPLPRYLFDRLVEAGVSTLYLNFSGGSDEGYLYIGLLRESGERAECRTDMKDLVQAVDDWAWQVFDYSGAGDGADYGDDYEYDLKNMTTQHTEWCTVRKYQDTETSNFSLEEGEQES